MTQTANGKSRLVEFNARAVLQSGDRRNRAAQEVHGARRSSTFTKTSLSMLRVRTARTMPALGVGSRGVRRLERNRCDSDCRERVLDGTDASMIPIARTGGAIAWRGIAIVAARVIQGSVAFGRRVFAATADAFGGRLRRTNRRGELRGQPADGAAAHRGASEGRQNQIARHDCANRSVSVERRVSTTHPIPEGPASKVERRCAAEPSQ